MRMMKSVLMNRKLALVALLPIAMVASCERSARLEVRTFDLEHLQASEAAALIEPYVFSQRSDGAGGSVSIFDGAITVRETSDNLEQISRVLSDYDAPQPETQLYFQLIEANGFTGVDSRIAAVEGELRKLFQFGGYRLAGEAFVSVVEGSNITQALRTDDGMFQIDATVYRMAAGVIRLEGISLYHERTGMGLETTVNIRPGQTLVLGTSPKAESTSTLLLTLRAEEGPGPA